MVVAVRSAPVAYVRFHGRNAGPGSAAADRLPSHSTGLTRRTSCANRSTRCASSRGRARRRNAFFQQQPTRRAASRRCRGRGAPRKLLQESEAARGAAGGECRGGHASNVASSDGHGTVVLLGRGGRVDRPQEAEDEARRHLCPSCSVPALPLRFRWEAPAKDDALRPRGRRRRRPSTRASSSSSRVAMSGSSNGERGDPGCRDAWSSRIIPRRRRRGSEEALVEASTARSRRRAVVASSRELASQQPATAEVLDAISRPAFDLAAVFDTLARNAVTLCRADAAQLYRFDGRRLPRRGPLRGAAGVRRVPAAAWSSSRARRP